MIKWRYFNCSCNVVAMLSSGCGNVILRLHTSDSFHSREAVLVCTEWSVSWLLHGLSQSDRLRDCRPRPQLLTSGRPLDESWPPLGKSILLRTADRSESGRSVNRVQKWNTQFGDSASAVGIKGMHIRESIGSLDSGKSRIASLRLAKLHRSSCLCRDDPPCMWPRRCCPHSPLLMTSVPGLLWCHTTVHSW